MASRRRPVESISGVDIEANTPSLVSSSSSRSIRWDPVLHFLLFVSLEQHTFAFQFTSHSSCWISRASYKKGPSQVNIQVSVSIRWQVCIHICRSVSCHPTYRYLPHHFRTAAHCYACRSNGSAFVRMGDDELRYGGLHERQWWWCMISELCELLSVILMCDSDYYTFYP